MNQTMDARDNSAHQAAAPTQVRPSSSKPLKASFNDTDSSLKKDLA